MSSDSKYVVFDTPDMEDEMYVFPCWVNHADFVRRMPNTWKPVSAGFISIGDIPSLGACAYGKSTTLNLESRRDRDSILAARLLNLGGEL